MLCSYKNLPYNLFGKITIFLNSKLTNFSVQIEEVIKFFVFFRITALGDLENQKDESNKMQKNWIDLTDYFSTFIKMKFLFTTSWIKLFRAYSTIVNW